jgi:glycosyltransferase involved in cell wall biosynthesis
MRKLSILVPAYNEAPTVRRLIEKIVSVSYPVPYELVIVDDFSVDGTYDIVSLFKKERQDIDVKLLRNNINSGKGASLQKGLKVASGDVAVVQDADFEYDPSEIPKLLEPILKGEASVVYGSRFLGNKKPNGMAYPNYVANRFLTWLTNILYGGNLTDMETCYKVVSMDIIRSIQLNANRFDFEPELTTKILKKGISIKELPISYVGRSSSEGKKIGTRDFIVAIKVLLRNLFLPCSK